MWIALSILAAVFVLVYLARRAFRADVRRRFREFLQARLPDWTVTEETGDTLKLRSPEGFEGEVYLWKLYLAAASTPQEQHEQMFQEFLKAIEEGEQVASQDLSLEAHAGRVMPRLVQQAFFQQLPPGQQMPRRPLGDTGLAVVYVLDSPSTVAYLTQEQAEELGLPEPELHALALQNLRARFDPGTVRGVLDGGKVALVAAGDTYDAARVLLVPECLQEGERLMAAVPDRDTLILAPGNDDAAVQRLKQLRPAAGDAFHPLLDRMLEVRPSGIALA